MSADGSITRWINDLRRGDNAAAGELWAAYFARMVAVAGRKLTAAGRAADDEDAALSAFKSFCLGAKAGRFPQLTDRGNLWPLLLALTAHKCVDQIRHATRLKRGGPAGNVAADLDLVTSREPTPELLAEVNERLVALLDCLDRTGDPALRRIAVWKLEGESTDDIAERLGCSRRTVERKLAVVELVWDREADDPAGGDP
ncbi:MAG TPA: ECF-type sigma factor [Urbifossiella sp.]|nr:ECF-type sigma factor [Urbifossiella sp.]